MATKIKVKKITDLTKIVAEQGTAPDDSKVILSGDQLVVAHKTNDDGAGGGVMHSTAMEVEELLKYISNRLESKYMTLEAGGQLSGLVEAKLQEAEENMAKGNDVYSSNYFVDDSGLESFDIGNKEVKNSISSWASGTYIFKSTSTANVHLTIYNTNAATSTGSPKGQAYAKIQILSKAGDWKTLCQQPLQTADGALDVDLHGYFFAGTKIRGLIEQQDPNANKVDFQMSNMQVTRFSSEEGFEENSFDWWVSNEGALTSDMQSPQAISSPGFVSFSGLYWTDTRNGVNATDTIVGSKTTDYIVNKIFRNHYCMNAVYANLKYQNGNPYRLGCTEKDNIAYTKNSGITDDFSGKYYYINPSQNNPVSVFTTTDFTFKDTAKPPKADSGGGWRNATLIKYTNYDEISSVVGTELSDTESGTIKVPVKVYTYGEITAKYETTTQGYTAPHRFQYSGGLGYYTHADASCCTRFYPYVGADQRNIASLGIKQYSDSAGCYMRESQSSWSGNAGMHGTPPPDKYVFLPASLGEQRIRSVIRDDDPEKWRDLGDDPRWYDPVNYYIDVLNENVERIGVGKEMAKYKSTFTPVSSLPSVAVIDNWLTSEVSAGWPLISVSLQAPGSDKPLTLNDFAFAACPRLSSFVFPANTAATGVYTFAAPSKPVNYILAGDNYKGNKLSVVTAKTPNMSQLTSVTFHHSANENDPCTHIEGYDGHPGETVAMFSNCQNLLSVNLEDTDVQNLGTYSFLNCKKLESIKIPQTCTVLGASVFEGCSSLTSITFPSSLQTFKRNGKIGSPSVVDFKSCSPCVIYKNPTTGGSSDYQYKLGTTSVNSKTYNINIQLSRSQAEYGFNTDAADWSATLDDYRSKIFPEISALVNYLTMQGLGARTYTKFTVSSNVVKGISQYGAGRRYYIIDKDGLYVNLSGVAQSDSTQAGNLTFNTIATADTVPVQNMIVPYTGNGTSDYVGCSPSAAYCVMYC